MLDRSGKCSSIQQARTQILTATTENRLRTETEPLRIGVWHHPVTGNEKIADDAFLEQLRQEKFRLCLHGHVHEDRADLIGYLHPRKLHVVGAGSFGAQASDRPEAMPKLYNLLEIARDHSSVRVRTRCMKRAGGAWEGWAVWPSDRPDDRRTYYNGIS